MEKVDSTYRRAMSTRTIPNDTERQRVLNQERFPGRNYNPYSIQRPESYQDEATQTINPITGKAYEDFEKQGDNREARLELRRVGELQEDKIIYLKSELDFIPRDPSDLEFFNCQLALARKDARDRRNNYSQMQHDYDCGLVVEVIQTLESAGLPLTSINTAGGLSDAMTAIERKINDDIERRIKDEYNDPFYNFPIYMNMVKIPKRDTYPPFLIPDLFKPKENPWN